MPPSIDRCNERKQSLPSPYFRTKWTLDFNVLKAQPPNLEVSLLTEGGLQC